MAAVRRRHLLPVALLLVVVVAGGTAVAGAVDARAGSAPSSATRAVRLGTPMLSARRAPELLSRTVAHVRLRTALDRAMTSPAVGRAGATSCLSVEEGDADIYGRQADMTLVPASTLKVLTGVAALSRLGPQHQFVTEVRADRPVVDGVLDGPLWLVGAGDPLLSTKDYADSFRNQPQVYTSIDLLADRIVAAGVREIRGGVLGDESRFDTVRYVPTWKPGYITDNEIGPVSALVVNDNFVQFRPKKTIAAPTTATATHGARVLTDLLRGRGVVITPEPAEGVAPAGASAVASVTSPPLPEIVGELLRGRGVVIAPEPAEGVAPAGASAVASVTSPPLPEIVGELLRESDNMTAEVLTKELGKRFGDGGTWAAGTAVIRETVAKVGLPAQGYAAVDGSGLDVSNRLSCSLLMDALDLVGRDSPVTAGFAIAGQTGTLALRFKGNPAEGRLRAKTGSLNFVSGLVGFVDAADDRSLEFALIANDLPDRNDSGRALQERVGAVLATYPQAPPAANLEPLEPVEPERRP